MIILETITNLITCTCQWRIQDFPWGGMDLVGGRGLPRQLCFEKFICQNERIWTLRRGRAPGTPLDPPMHVLIKLIVSKTKAKLGCIYLWYKSQRFCQLVFWSYLLQQKPDGILMHPGIQQVVFWVIMHSGNSHLISKVCWDIMEIVGQSLWKYT